VDPPATITPADTLATEQMPYGAGTGYMLGVTLMEQGDYEEALPYLYHAYRLSPDTPEIAKAYLSVLLGLGYGLDALGILAEMIEQDPADAELRRQKIALLADMRQYEEALAEVAALRATGEETLELQLVEASLLVKLDRADEAISLYRELLTDTEANREQIYLLLADLLMESGRKQEVDDLWQNATTDLPTSRALQYGYLRYLVRTERWEDAHQLAIQNDSSESQVRAHTGVAAEENTPAWQLEFVDLLVQADEYERATEILNGLADSELLDLEASLWLARLLMRAERPLASLQLLRKLADRWPDSDQAQYYLGDMLTASGDLETGEPHLREAIRLNPRQAAYHLALARMLTVKHAEILHRRKPATQYAEVSEEVAQVARAASALLTPKEFRGHMILGFTFRAVADDMRAQEHFAAAAESKEFRKEALLQLAICQVDAGEGQKAQSSLETLWQEYPGDPVVANSLGYFLAEKGVELTRAERLIRLALAEEPDNGAYIDSYGWVLYQQGHYQEAFDQLVLAANALPDDATILEHMGMALRALGQNAEAIRVLRRALDLGGDPERLEAAIQELENAPPEP
jgi:tetratricopeptide (TPR) repeat protein